MYLVPDMPYAIKMQMLRENFLSKEALYNAETIKAARERTEEHNVNYWSLFTSYPYIRETFEGAVIAYWHPLTLELWLFSLCSAFDDY